MNKYNRYIVIFKIFEDYDVNDEETPTMFENL